MGNYENLKQSITEVIRTNGNQEITGAVLQSTLLTIISTVGANATFVGIATPTTNPGTPDGSVFYLASESGTYTNFGGVELQDGLSVLMWNGSWSGQQIFGIDDEPTAGSDNLVKSGGVYTKISELGERTIPKEIEKTFTTQTASFSVDEYQENIESYIEIKSGNDSVNTLIFFNVGSGGWNRLLQVAVNNNKTYKVTIPATTNTIQVIHSESQGEKSCKLKISYIGTIPYNIDELGESVDVGKINIANNTRDINDLRDNYVALDVSKQEKCEILNANVSKSGSRYLSISKGVLDLYIKREGGDSNLGLCAVTQSGDDYVLAFYEVDEAGNFIDAMKGIAVTCKKLKGNIYYAFDVVKNNPSDDSDILTISVIVDMDVLGTFSGYRGVMLNEDVFKEHIGLIDELKESENIKEYESRIAKRNVYVAPLIFTGLWMQNGIIKSGDTRYYAIYAYKVEKNKTYRAECEIPNYADNWDNIAFIKNVDDIEAGNAIKQLSTGGNVCAGIDYTATEDGYLLVAKEGDGCRVGCYDYAPSFEQNAETVEMPNKVFTKDDGIKEYTSPQFTPDTDKYVFVNLNNFVGNAIVKLYGVDGDVLLDQKTISSLDYEPYSFDTAFYPIYGTPPQTSYYVTIEGNFVADIVICQYKGKSGNVYENIVSQDNQLEELSRKIDATSGGDKYRIAPNGKKYLLQILNTGNVIGVPVIPNKALFIGNSLLMGQGNFGMNATSINNDYYWRLHNYLLSINPSYTDARAFGFTIENATSISEARTAINSFDEYLSADLDLVFIQLGENVNSANYDVFSQSSIEFIQHIRNICPQARVVWAGVFWKVNTKLDIIRNACDVTGAEFIDFSDINDGTPNTQSEVGAVIVGGNFGAKQINYTNLVIDDNKLTITFLFNGNSYTSVVNVDTYNDDSTNKVVSWTGNERVCTDNMYTTHPGDNGFRLIANRFAKTLGFSEVDLFTE